MKMLKMLERSLIFVGIKHCGKTTHGRRIAAQLGADFYDTDKLIEMREGRSPREIYNESGKEAFMLAEKNACADLREKIAGKPCVVAAGGGVCDNAEASAILKSLGTIVFLQADETLAVERIIREARFTAGGVPQNLPAYIAKENPHTADDVRRIFHEFYERRTAQYREMAEITVLMENAYKERNTQKILRALHLDTARSVDIRIDNFAP